MKHVTVFLLCMVIGLVSFGNDNPQQKVRNQFVAATQQPNLRADLVEQLAADVHASSAKYKLFTKAYLGATKTLLAESSVTPWTKYTLFKEGTELIESAIRLDPSNLEYRYLRFVVQVNAPSFLNYNKNISEDFEMLQKCAETKGNLGSWIEHFRAFERTHSALIQTKLKA